MSALGILNELDALLEGERIAIRRLDGPWVERAAMEKERLVRELFASEDAVGQAFRDRLKVTLDLLRRNGVLLAHARSCLRDVLAVWVDSPEGGTRTAAKAIL